MGMYFSVIKYGGNQNWGFDTRGYETNSACNKIWIWLPSTTSALKGLLLWMYNRVR
jgi:hypothetical protein